MSNIGRTAQLVECQRRQVVTVEENFNVAINELSFGGDDDMAVLLDTLEEFQWAVNRLAEKVTDVRWYFHTLGEE